MGLFDYIRCEMPMPDGSDGTRELQTKDTPEQYLETFVICSDGQIRLSGSTEPEEFHGDLRFYDENSTYFAHFTDGFCVRITNEASE